MANAENKPITRAAVKEEDDDETSGKRQPSKCFVMAVKENEKGDILSCEILPTPPGIPAGSESKSAAVKKAIRDSVANGEATYKGKRLAVMFMNSNAFHIGPDPSPAKLVILE